MADEEVTEDEEASDEPVLDGDEVAEAVPDPPELDPEPHAPVEVGW